MFHEYGAQIVGISVDSAWCHAAFAQHRNLHFPDDLRFAYRHFPLSQIHPHSFQAAEAAEAAGAQGRFWKMHDMLIEHQSRLGTQDLLAYAGALGLELEPFAEDLAEHRHAPRVREDFLTGVRSGVNGTPTFFVNGVRHDCGYDLASMLEAVQLQL